ncbi:MAG: hypothetical protein ACKV22_36680 [Bryobacteraceae bacterium]
MTITLDLPPEIEARFIAEAQATGVPVGEVVKAYLLQRTPPVSTMNLSLEEWDKAWDDLLDSMPDIPTLSDEAISRESIYSRDDE